MILFDYDKASSLMVAHGIDILLPNSFLNAGYLADHWKHELVSSFGAYLTGDDGVPFLFLVGLPCDQKVEPFVTCRTGGEESDMFYAEVWIEDKRRWGPRLPGRDKTAPLGPYNRIFGNPLEAAVDALHDRRLDRGTIGVELRFLGVEPYQQLRSMLPEARFVDALPLLNELRMVKSAEELRRMRVAAHATEQAIEVAFATVREGTTGLDLERVIGAHHYQAGVRHEMLHTCIGPGGAQVICPNDTPVQKGNVVRLDVASSYRHYLSDISRVAVLGDPSAMLLEAYGAMRKALEAVVDAARPGVAAQQLYDIGNTIVEDTGFENFLTIVGHGVGRDIHEIPFLQHGDLRVLEPGMTFSIELATMLNGLGCIALEDEIVITPNGSEPLSTKGRELCIMEAD